VVASFVVEIGGSTTEGYVVAVLVDDVVALLLMDSADGVDLEVVLELAEAQVACLEATDGCPEPLPLLDDLVED
jgi:hypothetical protein